jgi:ATP-dependent DNA helicase RecG
MSDEQLLKNLLKQGESEQLEFLEVVRKETIARNLCALLNGNGGRVVVGVSDDGKAIGIKDAQSHKNEIQSYLLNVIVPDTPITISVESIEERELLIFKVWGGSKQPYIFDGNIYFRRGSATQKATSKEISELIHGRQLSEQHWERQIVLGVELEDLDKKLIIDTINESRKNHRSNFKSDDVLEFLNHYGLYLNGSFTNACIVLFGKKPSKFVPQIRVRLTEYAEGKTDNSLIRDEVFEGNIFSIRNDLEKYVNSLGVRSVFDKNQWKRQDFTFPKRALQEGIINALMHRDYSSFSSGISISVYPDRFVISNSGKLPDDIKVKDLKKNHRSHPVNPDVAHIVFLRGLIDKLGRGTIKIIEECKDAGLRVPEWKETSSGIVLTFNGPKGLSEKKERNDAASDAVNDAVNDAAKALIRDAVSDAVNDAASDAVIERLIKEVLFIYAEDGKSLKDLMLTFDVARATMQRDMALLKAHQFIVFEGAAKSGVYRLRENFKLKIKRINGQNDSQPTQ